MELPNAIQSYNNIFKRENQLTRNNRLKKPLKQKKKMKNIKLLLIDGMRCHQLRKRKHNHNNLKIHTKQNTNDQKDL